MSVVEFKAGVTAVIEDYRGEVPEGKVFREWNTRADGTGVPYKPGRKVLMADSLHLYPMFDDAPKGGVE